MTNYFKQRREDVQQNTAEAPDIGVVQRVESNAGHIIGVQIKDDTGSQEAVRVPVNFNGDVGVPSVGDEVIVGYTKGGTPYLVGILYEDISYQEGERRIGTEDSYIAIEPDGTIRIHTDQEVVVETSNGTTTH